MTAPFAEYDRIRIINLAHRTDRRAQMAAELARIGLGGDPRVAFFDAVESATAAPWRAKGERGVFLSHLGVLRDAAAAGESVLILEDDADFTAALDTVFPEQDVDIFYGGYEALDPSSLESSDIIGAHCMGFSADTARRLVDFLDPLQRHESPPPIDGAYVWYRRAFPDARTQFAMPVVAVQRPSRSDIARLSWLDRTPVVRDAMSLGRRGKRSLGRGDITFGLPQAIVMAVVGLAIAVVVALKNLAAGP